MMTGEAYGDEGGFLLEAPPSRLIPDQRPVEGFSMWNYRYERYEPIMMPRSVYDLAYRDYIPQTQECLDVFDSLMLEGYGTIDAMVDTLEFYAEALEQEHGIPDA